MCGGRDRGGGDGDGSSGDGGGNDVHLDAIAVVEAHHHVLGTKRPWLW